MSMVLGNQLFQFSKKRLDLNCFRFQKDKELHVANLIPASEGSYFSAPVKLNFKLSYARLEYHVVNSVVIV